ncbi:APC family permease [Brevibacterium sp. VCM10]|uniref:APC family permease n=1 Tax=Brevibacterium sp. VCM10 TaxID=1381751 RepID=UPI0004716EEA|nr:APC family permease [Brevibacterium sp. VCM10]
MSSSMQNSVESFGYKQELKRSISTVDLIIYGLIFMVPIAPWAIFGTVYNESKGMVPLVYTIGLIAMIFTALSYSQMSRRVPLAGSVFSYVGAGIHPNLGFFAGWLMLLDYLLVPTLLYVFAAESMIGIFPGTERWVWALVFVAINTVVNLAGVNSIKLMNRVFLVMELFFVVTFVIIAVKTLNGGTLPAAEWSTTPIWSSAEVTAPLIAAALSIAVLSFLGFDGIATMAEESTGGHRSAGRAMITSLIVVAILFIGQTWLASMLAGNTGAFPDDKAGNAFFDIVAAASSTGWAKAFLVCNVLAVGIANAMAAQAATSRLLFSMSRDGKLPAFLKQINTKQVPRNAILVVSGLSAVLVIFFVGQIGLISSMVNFGALSGFLLLHLSVIWAYAVRDGSRNWLSHVVLPAIGFLIIGYVLVNSDVLAKLGGLSWLLVGIVVFIIYRKKGAGISAHESEESVRKAGQ